MSNMETYPAERRRHTRTRLEMTLGCIRLDPDGGDVVDSLRMVDISRGGMGAYAGRSFYPGQRIVLHLPLPTDTGRRNIYATITRCSHNRDRFRVGFAFDTPYAGQSYVGMDTAAAAA